MVLICQAVLFDLDGVLMDFSLAVERVWRKWAAGPPCGSIYATPPTIDLCSVILPDSGHLQERGSSFAQAKGNLELPSRSPSLHLAGGGRLIGIVSPAQFGETKALCDQLSFRFVHASHILDAGMVEVVLHMPILKSCCAGSAEQATDNFPGPWRDRGSLSATTGHLFQDGLEREGG